MLSLVGSWNNFLTKVTEFWVCTIVIVMYIVLRSWVEQQQSRGPNFKFEYPNFSYFSDNPALCLLSAPHGVHVL